MTEVVHLLDRFETTGQSRAVTSKCGATAKEPKAEPFTFAVGWFTRATCPACRDLAEQRG